jgi:hypothetical protein
MSDSNKNYAERYNGVWAVTDTNIGFKREWSGVVFTDEQCEALLKGDVIEFKAISKSTGKPYTAKGSLAEQEYNGRKYIGFKADFSKGSSNDKKPSDKTTTEKSNTDRYTGVWKKTGETVSFKREWSGTAFTDKQCNDLLDGKIITIEATSKKTSEPYTIRGILSEQEYNGRKFIGFEKGVGIVDIPHQFQGYVFSTDEIAKLKAGQTIFLRHPNLQYIYIDVTKGGVEKKIYIDKEKSKVAQEKYVQKGREFNKKRQEEHQKRQKEYQSKHSSPYESIGRKYGDWSAHNAYLGKGWECPLCHTFVPADWGKDCLKCRHIAY